MSKAPNAAAKAVIQAAQAKSLGRVKDLTNAVVASIRGVNMDDMPRSGVTQVSADELRLLRDVLPVLIRDHLDTLKVTN